MNVKISYIIFSIIVLSLLVYGALSVLFTPLAIVNDPTPTPVINPTPSANGVQTFSLRATGAGTYEPQTITVKKGVPVEINFSADARSGCGRQIVFRDFGINEIVNGNETKKISFTPQKAGTFEFACGMRMFRGKLTVVE